MYREPVHLRALKAYTFLREESRKVVPTVMKFTGHDPKQIAEDLRRWAKQLDFESTELKLRLETLTKRFDNYTMGFVDVRDFCEEFAALFGSLARELRLFAGFVERNVHPRHVDWLQYTWEVCGDVHLKVVDTFREQCLPDCDKELWPEASPVWRSVNFTLKLLWEDLQEIVVRLRLFEGKRSDSPARTHDAVRIKVEAIILEVLRKGGDYREVLKALDQAGEGSMMDRLFKGYRRVAPEIQCWKDIADHPKPKANFQTWLSKFKGRHKEFL
jgi:hypothetical protein